MADDNKAQKKPMRTVDEYPLWYVPVKWLLPISIALMVGLTVGLATVGILPIPFSFGKIAWLPAVYASLDTFKAAGLVLGLSLSSSAIVGLGVSFLLKATILFQVNERIGTQGQKAQEEIQYQHEYIDHLTKKNRFYKDQLFRATHKEEIKRAQKGSQSSSSSESSEELESYSSESQESENPPIIVNKKRQTKQSSRKQPQRQQKQSKQKPANDEVEERPTRTLRPRKNKT